MKKLLFEPNKLYSRTEASKKLHVSWSTLHRRNRKGLLPSILGPNLTIYYKGDDLNKLYDESYTVTIPPAPAGKSYLPGFIELWKDAIDLQGWAVSNERPDGSYIIYPNK